MRIIHVEDESESVQDDVYAAISDAGAIGIQLTPQDFTVDGGVVCIDGMRASDWIEAMSL